MISIDEREELAIRNSMFRALVEHALAQMPVDSAAIEEYAHSAVSHVMERLRRDGLLG